MTEPSDERRYAVNLQGERDSAALYRTLAEVEKNPQLAEIYRKLAAVEDSHAEFWKKRLIRLGASIPDLRMNLRTRVLRWLAKMFGPAVVLPSVNTLEQIDSGQYNAQPDAVAGGLPQAERSHARIIEALAGARPETLSGGTLARLEGRHRGMGGNALRAAVLGANDGLVSNLSLVMGIAGASLPAHTILITGVAGLLAGACSMAMGEWLSVSTARESYQRQIRAEAEELEEVPEEEKEELALIYQAKGLPEEQARALAEKLMANKDTALDALTREELGINPDDLGGSAWVAAFTSFGLFALGAVFPIVPYAFGFSDTTAVLASLGFCGLALFAIGAATTLFTGRGAVLSGLRQLAFGFGAAAITFGLGRLIGVTVAG